MTGVHMHRLTCPACDHRFYVKLLDEEGEDNSGETECVECESLFERSYEYEINDDGVEVDVDIALLEDNHGE